MKIFSKNTQQSQNEHNLESSLSRYASNDPANQHNLVALTVNRTLGLKHSDKEFIFVFALILPLWIRSVIAGFWELRIIYQWIVSVSFVFFFLQINDWTTSDNIDGFPVSYGFFDKRLYRQIGHVVLDVCRR